MRKTLLVLVLLLVVQQAGPGAEPKVVFEDPLKGSLGQGWTWLRENPAAWRHTPKGLEIRVEPGLAFTQRSSLVRSNGAKLFRQCWHSRV